MNCLVCDKLVKPEKVLNDSMSELSEEDVIFNTDKSKGKVSSFIWVDGVVSSISAGYGSKKDGDVYVIAICDDCIDNLHASGKIYYKANGFFSAPDDERLLKSKELFKAKLRNLKLGKID